MRHTIAATLLITLAFGSGNAASSSLRPGMWEYTTTVKTQSGEMEKAMAQMEQQMAMLPPEQRKMMEQTMAAQGVAKSSKPNTYQICVTKEDAQKGLIPSSDPQCRQKIVRKSGNTVWFTYTCKGNPPTKGEGTYTLIGDNAYKGTMKVRTMVNGKTETVEMVTKGKWLSKECKTLKNVR